MLSRLFRRLILEALLGPQRSGQLTFFGDLAGLANADTFTVWLASFRKSEWVVYAKLPFGGPKVVLAYLSRYTHRVAISNNRLIRRLPLEGLRIKTGHRHKVLRITTGEFIRRFLNHVLPDGFHRTRHYGLLA